MSTSLEKILKMRDTIYSYSNNTTEDNIQARLEKCLQLYLSDLNTSYYYLIDNINKKSIIRGLNK